MVIPRYCQNKKDFLTLIPRYLRVIFTSFPTDLLPSIIPHHHSETPVSFSSALILTYLSGMHDHESPFLFMAVSHAQSAHAVAP